MDRRCDFPRGAHELTIAEIGVKSARSLSEHNNDFRAVAENHLLRARTLVFTARSDEPKVVRTAAGNRLAPAHINDAAVALDQGPRGIKAAVCGL